MLTVATSANSPFWVGCCPLSPLQATHAAITPAIARRRRRSIRTAAHFHFRHARHVHWNSVVSHAVPSHPPVEPESDAHRSKAISPVERSGVEQNAAHDSDLSQRNLDER